MSGNESPPLDKLVKVKMRKSKHGVEQRSTIKYCVLEGKSPSYTFRLLKEMYEENCLSRSTVFHWHKRFQDGRGSLLDDPRSGRPSTATNNKIVDRAREIISQNPALSVDALATALAISSGSAHRILSEKLGMYRVGVRWLPYFSRLGSSLSDDSSNLGDCNPSDSVHSNEGSEQHDVDPVEIKVEMDPDDILAES